MCSRSNRPIGRHLNDDDSGFTLVELLIVVVVLGVIAAIVIFNLGGTSDQAEVAACKANAKLVAVATEAYKTQHSDAIPMPSDLTAPPEHYLQTYPTSPYYTITIDQSSGNVEVGDGSGANPKVWTVANACDVASSGAGSTPTTTNTLLPPTTLTTPPTTSTTTTTQPAASPHTVTFDNNGGFGSMSNETHSTATPLSTNTFTRFGRSFSGWNTAADGSGTAYADGATYSFSADVTLYAQWTGPHTVTFDNNGGFGFMSDESHSAPTALSRNSFVRLGYNFSGWNTAADGSGTAYADGATYSFSADVTLYAQWTGPHTVSFDRNGGSGSMADESHSTPRALDTNDFTRSGYSFNGWNTAADGSGTAYADGATYSFSADVTLYAQWVRSHTVSFDNNNGFGSMSDETRSAPAALSANTFVRNGYSFSGWNTAANGSGTAYNDGATYSFGADVTLYAQWVRSHTVSFDNNNGFGSMPDETHSAPAALSANTFRRTGYTFIGWNTSSSGRGTAYADGATYSFGADVTLYAQWHHN